jgi:hypothetical protein
MIKDLIGTLCVPKDNYYNQTSTLINGDVSGETVVYNSDAVALSSLSGEALYAGYFDGNSSLSIPTDSSLGFGTGDFTIEFRINRVYFGTGNESILDWREANIFQVNPNLVLLNDRMCWFVDGSSMITGPVLSLDTWHHVSLVKQSSVIKLFLNGVSVASAADTNNYPAPPAIGLRIGSNNWSGAFAKGYISNLRIVKGQALYTSNFAPPVSRLTTSSNGGATPSTAPTPANVSLLTLQDANIHIDNSPTPKPITATGRPYAQIIPAGLNWTEALYAGYFNGSSYLDISSNSAFAFPNGTDFTIECWINFSDFTNNRFYNTNGGTILYFANGVPTFGIYSGAIILTSSIALQTNTWYHIAVTRNGIISRMFVNGIQTAINNNDTTSYSQNNLRIGGDFSVYRTTGYASNLRVVKGQALYTSNFTPPVSRLTTSSNGGATPSTAPTPANVSLLALQDANVLTDNSPTPKTITATGSPYALNAIDNRYSRKMHGNQNDLFSNKAVALSSLSGATDKPVVWTEALHAGYFNGSSYITAPTINFASNEAFTIEFWINGTTASGALQGIIACQTGLSFNGWSFTFNPTTNIFGLEFNASGTITSSIAAIKNVWNHVAVTRNSSGLITMYINGQAAGTATNANATASSGVLVIGGDRGPSARFLGYISNFRVVKGQALYTSNFTPPTSRLTTSSNGGATPSVAPIPYNVSLLALQTASVYDDNSFSPKTITRTGDATMTQHQHADQTGKIALGSISPWSNSDGYWSGYFDGSSYLNVSSPNEFRFGTGDFTVECYVYVTDASMLYPTILEIGNHDTIDGAGFFIQSAANDLTPFVFAKGNFSPTGRAKLSMNSWNHVVWQRTSGNLKIYVNGVGSNNISFTNNIVSSGSSNVSIGYVAGYNGSLAGFAYKGYISNFRVVKGQALYSGNFTPSTIPLTVSSNGSIKSIPYTEAKTNAGWTESLYAGYFDGNSFLNFYGANLNFGTNNFTIEFWYYSNDVSGTQIFLGGVDPAHEFGIINNGQIAIGKSGFYGMEAFGNATVVANRWNHIAYVRNGIADQKVYVNGVASNTRTYGESIEFDRNNTGSRIGLNHVTTPSNLTVKGYISNFRIVKGQALYTSNFTPPVSRLTTSSNGGATPSTAPTPANVALLMLQDANVHIDNSPTPKTITSSSPTTLPAASAVSLLTLQNNKFVDVTPPLSALSGAGNWTEALYAGYFDGSASYLTTTSTEPFNYSGDLTIEMWFFPQSSLSQNGSLISKRGSMTDVGGIEIVFATTNGTIYKPILYVSYNNSSWAINTNSTINCNTGQWNHIAVTRSGNQWKLFVNGVVGVDQTAAGTFVANAAAFTIGAGAANGEQKIKDAYISNLRIVKNQALYTSNFTPPVSRLTTSSNGGATPSTAPTPANVSLLALQDANILTDNSPTPKTITTVGPIYTSLYAAPKTITATGTPRTQTYNPFKQFRMQKTSFSSGRFDGASYLTAPASTAYALSGDFTIEFWVNTNVFSLDTNARHIISLGTGADATNLLKIFLGTAGGASSDKIQVFSGTTGFTGVASKPVADGGWHHIAVVRSGSALKTFVDGLQDGTTATTSQSFSAGATTNIQIGRINSSESGRFNGYISNLRIVNGTAIYTGPFTPPVAPVQISGAASAASYSTLTNVNTTFPASACAMLLDFDDAGVYDATGNTAIATYSQARSSDVQSKWNNKQSLYFNGSSYITYTPTPNFGTDPFTVEAWVWPVNAAGFWTVIDNRPGAGWILGQGATAGRLAWYNGTSWLQASTQVTTSSAWNHVMYTRSAGIGRLYCNGTFVVSASDTVNYNNPSVTTGFIGSFYDFNAGEFMNGYIDDLRITTGVARTSAYTYVVPPRPAPIK